MEHFYYKTVIVLLVLTISRCQGRNKNYKPINTEFREYNDDMTIQDIRKECVFVVLLGILARLAILDVYHIIIETFAATTQQKITMIARALLLKHVMLRGIESGGT